MTDLVQSTQATVDHPDTLLSSEAPTYLWQQPDWPNWQFDLKALTEPLAEAHQSQARLIAQSKQLTEARRTQLALHFLVDDIRSTSIIEGEHLDPEAVRTSLARHLSGSVEQADQQVDGVVSTVLEAITHYAQPLTSERLFSWHDTLFPSSYCIISTINTESWRDDIAGPMQVVSGPIGHQKIHYQAPPAQRLNEEMTRFIGWFNAPATMDPFLKAGLAHLWFLTIHPFGDGNGRIARAISDMALTRAHGMVQRLYSYSAQLLRERADYYAILERTQKSDLDVTDWLRWFLQSLNRAMVAAEDAWGHH